MVGRSVRGIPERRHPSRIVGSAMIGPVVALDGDPGELAILELGGVTVLALAVRQHRKVAA